MATQRFNPHKPTLFFDFDGTLADTIECNFKIFNQLSCLYKHLKITIDQMHEFRELHISEILKRLKIGCIRKLFLVMHARLIMNQYIQTIQPFPGLFEVLLTFREKFNFAVISTNSKTNIEYFMIQHSPFCFNLILGGIGVFSKGHAIKKLMKQEKLQPKTCFYIGDELRDIDLAKFCQIQSIAVSWGCNSKLALLKAKPDHLVESAESLQQVLCLNLDSEFKAVTY